MELAPTGHVGVSLAGMAMTAVKVEYINNQYIVGHVESGNVAQPYLFFCNYDFSHCEMSLAIMKFAYCLESIFIIANAQYNRLEYIYSGV